MAAILPDAQVRVEVADWAGSAIVDCANLVRRTNRPLGRRRCLPMMRQNALLGRLLHGFVVCHFEIPKEDER